MELRASHMPSKSSILSYIPNPYYAYFKCVRYFINLTSYPSSFSSLVAAVLLGCPMFLGAHGHIQSSLAV
jgi:hypothetical protein